MGEIRSDGEERDRDLVRAMKAAMDRQAGTGRRGPRRSVAAAGDADRPAPPDRPARVAFRMDLVNRNDPHALERIVGARDIVSVNFLERGLHAAKAVCRVKTLVAGGGPAAYATGFLASPALLVTNHHVLPDPETASRSLAEFGMDLDRNFVERRGRIVPLAPTTVFYTNADLDVTIVGVSPMAHDGTPTTDFGVLPLLPTSGKGVAGEYVSIIQHPEGGTKQVVVRENRIVALDPAKFPDIDRGFIHYTADTEMGSSGSPVFNDQWDLVAIHHRAIADRDDAGRPLNRHGSVWSEADGEAARKWIANQGTRVSALCAELRDAARGNAAAARILGALAVEPHGAFRQVRGDDRVRGRSRARPRAAPDLDAFEATRFGDPAFAASTGYDPDFLGADLRAPPPKPGRSFRGPLAKNAETGKPVFDYTHFSLAMHARRRLAAWTAVNIAGAELTSTRTDPGWRRDRRLPASEQTLAEVYGRVPGRDVQIDRGHLVRRLDPVWGAQDVADRAAADTYHYTNAAPQEHVYNDTTWGDLEDFVLARAQERDHKASVMTGPVLRPDDGFYGEGLAGGPWQIPWSFWKICVFLRPDGAPSVTGFVVEQPATLAPIFEATGLNPYTIDEARVFQRPIAVIEDLTGLDFGRLRGMDRMGEVETTAAEAARPIRDARDILF